MGADVIDIVVNGEPRRIPEGLSVEAFLRHAGIDPERVAVEMNREIVRRAAWPETVVPAEARIEVVQFVGGG